MTRVKNRGFKNQHSGRPFRGGGYFTNYKQRGNIRPPPQLPPPPHFFPSPGNFGFPVPNFDYPRNINRFPMRLPINPNFRMMRGGGGRGRRGNGMSHWRGASKKQSPKTVKNSLTPTSKKSKLMEKDVGITEYISLHDGFNGIIKQRFSDFHVNEILNDGNFAKLTDMEPPVDIEHKRPENEITEILTEEIMEKVKTMIETKSGSVEIEVTEKSKDDRRKIHEAVKDGFGKEVYSNTVDRGSKKFITILKTKKGVMQDHRLRWPAERGGVYVHFVLHKENMDTQETVNYIAGRLGVKPNFITYAGTKDRRAVTSQMMSVFKIDPVRLANLNNELRGVKLGNFSYKPTCLKLGDLKGNRFRISLRNVTGTDQQIEEAMNSLKERGFLNYYGLQRFGSSSSVPTPEVGRALLLGQWKEAIDLILKPRSTDEPWVLRKARKYWWATKDARKAAKMLRKNFMNIIESKLLYGLSRHAPDDFVGALQNIPRNTRLLYLHSYQSLVWNKIVSRRIKEFGLKPIVGDLVLVNSTTEYQEIVDQEGNVVASDDYPKRPRKRERKVSSVDGDNTTEQGNLNNEGEKDAENDIEDKGEDEGQKVGDETPVTSMESGVEEHVDGSNTEDNSDKNSEKVKSQQDLNDNTAKPPPPVRVITEEDLDNVKIEDIVLPLPGHNIVYPNNVIKEWYDELLAVDGLTVSTLKQNVRQYSVSGTYRRMIVRPENLTWKTINYSSATSTLIRSDLEELKNNAEPEDEPDGQFKALILDFCLPSATYATMALREILKVDTSAEHQASLNNYHIVKETTDTKEPEKSDGAEADGEISADNKTTSDVEGKEEDGSIEGLKRKAEETNESETDAALTDVKKVKLEDET